MNKLITTIIAIGLGVIFLSLPMSAQTETFESTRTAKEIKSFVERGAALIRHKGTKAFDVFRQKGSEWFQGDRYLFVWDMEGLRYVYPPNTKGEGEKMHDLRDSDGKPIGRLIIEAAASKEGAGWVRYRWPRPGEKIPSPKITYVMKVVSPSGKVFLIGSGAYDVSVQK